MWLWWLGILCDGHPFTSDPGNHSGDITRKDRPTETALQSKANTHNTQGNCVARQQSMAGHCDLAIISFGSSQNPLFDRDLDESFSSHDVANLVVGKEL